MKLSIYPILMLLLIGLACDLEEEDPDPIVINQEQLFIEEVTRNSVIYEDYTYNDKDQLISKRRYHDNGELRITYTYEYLEDKTITTRKSEENGNFSIYEYTKVDALTARRDRIYEDGSLGNYTLYEYENEEACFFNKTAGFTQNDYLQAEGTYEFLDENCSYLRTNKDQFGGILSKLTLVFDGKNRFDNAAKIPQLPTRYGNIVSYDYQPVDLGGFPFTYTANIEYNIFNYPTKQTLFLSDGGIHEFVYNYR